MRAKAGPLKHCQISFHALQSTASEMVTFTWPSIPPPVAEGPRHWLNQAQGPMNVEARQAGEQGGDGYCGAVLKKYTEHMSLCWKDCITSIPVTIILGSNMH